MDVCFMGMEGERRDKYIRKRKRMAPYSSRTPKLKSDICEPCNGKFVDSGKSGKRLKINVLKLSNSHLGGKNISLSTSKEDTCKAEEIFPTHLDFISNNNTITSELPKDDSENIDITPNEACRIGEPTHPNHICPNCTTVADSPQSILNEDSSSQASDSVEVKNGRLLQRSDSTSSCHSLDSKESIIQTDAVDSPPPPCRWTPCANPQVDLNCLHQHIISCHIQPQEGNDKYVCYWQGCRCYNKPSSSRSWIEHHVLNHSGDKPYQCIIEDCGLRFSSRCLLERHVRNHFLYQEQIESAKARENGSPCKGNRKKKVKKKLVRPVKTHDFFDARVMEHVKMRILEPGGRAAPPSVLPSSSTQGSFQTSVIARRRAPDGSFSVLLQPHSGDRSARVHAQLTRQHADDMDATTSLTNHVTSASH